MPYGHRDCSMKVVGQSFEYSNQSFVDFFRISNSVEYLYYSIHLRTNIAWILSFSKANLAYASNLMMPQYIFFKTFSLRMQELNRILSNLLKHIIQIQFAFYVELYTNYTKNGNFINRIRSNRTTIRLREKGYR